jgi:hypothetical protein
MRIHKDFDSAISRTLTAAGIGRYEITQGGKHPRLVFVHQGRRIDYVLPGSSSDHRALRNVVGDLRRLIGRPPAQAGSDRPDPTPAVEEIAQAAARVAANPPQQPTPRDLRLARRLGSDFALPSVIGGAAGDDGAPSLERLERLVALSLAVGDGHGRYRRAV